jgi:hypothetical protein
VMPGIAVNPITVWTSRLKMASGPIRHFLDAITHLPAAAVTEVAEVAAEVGGGTT